MVPGSAYWVENKSATAVLLTIPYPGIFRAQQEVPGIMFLSPSGRSIEEYDMPPPPPGGLERSNGTLEAGGSGAESRGCFIATAAFGSSLAPQVEVLRRFRDHVLMRSAAGRWFVELYYRLSPGAARWLETHPGWKPMVRCALAPVVAAARLSTP